MPCQPLYLPRRRPRRLVGPGRGVPIDRLRVGTEHGDVARHLPVVRVASAGHRLVRGRARADQLSVRPGYTRLTASSGKWQTTGRRNPPRAAKACPPCHACQV